MTNPEPTEPREPNPADYAPRYRTGHGEPVTDIIVLPLAGMAHVHRLDPAPDFAPTLTEQRTTFGGDDPDLQVHVIVARFNNGLVGTGSLQPNPVTCELCNDRHYLTIQVNLKKVCPDLEYCYHHDLVTEHFEEPTYRLACPACRTGDYLLTLTEPRWRRS
jgi:hypothetical protein